jgi:hypothetical protein
LFFYFHACSVLSGIFENFSERSMELQQGLNSFRRLLAYRIGQRFGLVHTTADGAYDVSLLCY